STVVPIGTGWDSTITTRVFGMSPRIARALGAMFTLAALGATAWFAAIAFFGWRRPEHEGIAARYGSLIVTVKDDPIRGAQPMPVASMAELVRLAKREQ